MKYVQLWKILTCGLCLFFAQCQDASRETVKSTYKKIDPSYRDIQFIPGDSLRFTLSDNSYNEIKSFNYFQDHGVEYMSFFDGRSSSINIYNFSTQVRVKKIKLKKWFKEKNIYKASVYIVNFDSIFITNQKSLYLYDSIGTLKKDIAFEKRNDQYACFENTQPAVLMGTTLYMGVRPWVTETSFPALKNWKLLYAFDLLNSGNRQYYSLSETYFHKLYGYNFLNYSYCFNNKGNFVFSFPADTNIYETNLRDIHFAYQGKSRFQHEDIQAVPEQAIKNDKAYQEFRMRDSYGPIYFDPLHKRYLRLARQKINRDEYMAKAGIKRQSVIVFDENFKIIGESELKGDFSFSSVFFTKDGSLYTRVDPKDEYALHFIRLNYREYPDKNQVTKK
ncbi:hypothetical protein A4H97_09470 [Niastella yeongjuensis]|uniref:DUF4221 domain-containing protein n=1 Tax=Niastella yeongjuensis TaxID=354355 RepID=A0A1V9EEL6_9BACT|nr:DUF4221 family protein [Niastella yeongjuensis]OQP44587.1 hypothetical protein A4H97_09470 [Niastella yeongjuensis]SEO82281.1 protein of unknown function [Niastella yeongjuensis]